MDDTSAEARTYDEEFDSYIEVALNPYGAWQAIQALAAERDELQARVERLEAFVKDFALRAKSAEHRPDEQWLIDHEGLLYQRDCDIEKARAALAELKGQER